MRGVLDPVKYPNQVTPFEKPLVNLGVARECMVCKPTNVPAVDGFLADDVGELEAMTPCGNQQYQANGTGPPRHNGHDVAPSRLASVLGYLHGGKPSRGIL